MSAEAVVDHLIKLGYLNLAQPEHFDEARTQMIRSIDRGHLRTSWRGDDDPATLDGRIFAADSESLAEGGVGSMILEMRRILEAEGVSLGEVEDVVDEETGRYEIVVDGRVRLIYDPAVNCRANDWGLAFKRLLEIVNDLFRAVDSPERAYGVYGGSESEVIILTQKMYDFLQRSVEWDPRCVPYPSSAITEDGVKLG